MALLVGLGLLAGCQASGRTQALTAGGAGLGALIGAQQGGTRGAVLGAAIGGLAGFALGTYLDDLEQAAAKRAAYSAARSGSARSASVRNRKGQRTRIQVAVVKTYKKPDGRTCRDTATTIQRDGQTSSGGRDTLCQVKVGSRNDWPPLSDDA